MSKPTDIKKVREILRLKFGSHLSNRDVAKSLNVGSSTVSDIVIRFNNALLNWPLPDDFSDDDLISKIHPVKNGKRVVPNYGQMDIELRRKGVTKLLLWEEYQRENPKHFYGYSQYCENYMQWKSKQKRSMRQLHKAGEKIFIDYCGPTMPIVNPDTGECRQVQVFVAVLGASNYTFAIATENQKSESWLNAHNSMFNFFGGVAQLLVYDYVPRHIINFMFPSPLCCPLK
jgi:transposase